MNEETQKLIDSARAAGPHTGSHEIAKKELLIKQLETNLELIDTLNRLDKSNKRLAKTNIWLQVFVAVLTAITVYKLIWP